MNFWFAVYFSWVTWGVNATFIHRISVAIKGLSGNAHHLAGLRDITQFFR
jgi:hypothetical protein